MVLVSENREDRNRNLQNREQETHQLVPQDEQPPWQEHTGMGLKGPLETPTSGLKLLHQSIKNPPQPQLF